MSPTHNSYSEVLSELECWGSYETSAQPRDISKLLGIQHLLEDLNHPEKHYKIIHIAGTNGKGLTATMISSLLRLQGYNSGCYTSPHLTDIRERITLNGQWVSQNAFAQSAAHVLSIARSYQGKPYLSYFDLLTAIAFQVFRQEEMEWVVLETGLGGRADSTNVTEKELCILTRIGLDHQQVLGNKLIDVAAEKTGITRTDVPVIIAPQLAELKLWLQNKFSRENIPAYFVEDYFDTQFFNIDVTKESFSLPWWSCFQTSLSAMQILFSVDNNQKIRWSEAAQKVKLAGRLDLRHNVGWSKHALHFKTMLFDGGHNSEALSALVEFIANNKLEACTLILGMASDKLNDDLKAPLIELCNLAKRLILTPTNSARSATPDSLRNFIWESEGLGQTFDFLIVASAEEALEKSLVFSDTAVVVAGSFYLVGEVLQILENQHSS
ncbi:MAG: bifunctional folylpolyglutamate synthase/ dihydrofolate synthase [SAR324 cluster bacterium]|nr:bifunctional folylpolyglutamate synthase/ dihydrofolate synthase [SAR324 cluster bacterium]MBL7034894.1 bifunctional folylpolyglutamate synthase/ dihydrofolate synthase [SAR324 cluster bacterium]